MSVLIAPFVGVVTAPYSSVYAGICPHSLTRIINRSIMARSSGIKNLSFSTAVGDVTTIPFGKTTDEERVSF